MNSLFTRFRGYGILTIALALFAVSILFSFDKMLKEQDEVARSAGESTIWSVTQTQVALYRVLDALHGFGTADTALSHDELLQRFSVFAGQLIHLHEGPIAVKLAEIQGADQLIGDLISRVPATQRNLASLVKGERAAADKIEHDLRAFEEPLSRIADATLRRSNVLAESQRRRFQEVYFQLLLYFAGAFIGGTLLLVLLFRGIRKADRLLEERERTEERLRESEQRFRDYAASSSDWLWETDADGRFSYFSKGYLEKVGLSAIEIAGKSHEALAIVEGDEEAWRAQRLVTAKQQPFRDFRYRMAAGDRLRHIKVSGVPIFAPNGGFLGYRGTGTDITAQVEAESEAVHVRSLLSEAVESLDEGFALFDAEDRLVQCNNRFRELYGDRSGSVVPGATFAEIMRAAARERRFPDAAGREEAWVRERVERHRDSRQPDELQLSDGRWIQAREKLLDTGWRVGTRIDITFQKRREEALRREALIWEQMSDGVIVTDLHGHITNFNPAAERMFGYAESEVVGQTPLMLHRTSDASRIDRILAALGDQGWNGELDFRRKDGGAGVAETVVLPLRDDRGEQIAVIWVNHDITARKEGEAELLTAKEQAELANQAKSQFLATMSHEIRTPMNGVLGMISLLLDTQLDREQRSYAETVRESGSALVTIIDDILDFSKMEVGKLTLEHADFDLRLVVEGVVDLLAPRAQSKGIDIGAFLAPDVPSALRGDPGRLRQILLNLAGNAVKFTERGGIAVMVTIGGGSPQQPRLMFEIVDTGIGIPEHLQGGLFAEFTQADPSFTRRYGGTGLGLAISKKLTEMMDGEIGFASKHGEGSRFWFTAEFEATAPLAAPAPPRQGRFRVLVVDDNETAANIFALQLGAEGLAAATVSHGKQALEALRASAEGGDPFKLVLIDELLAEEGGLPLARRIRQESRFAATKLVLITPLASRVDAAGWRAAGFDASLAKPTRQAALAACLARLLEPSVAASAQESPTAATTLGEARLLLVEDSPVNHIVAAAMLAKQVGSIDTAKNGREAIAAIQAKHYDLILMDIAMPEMDGIEATRIVRALPAPKGYVPIVAMTAHTQPGDRERCLAAGMDDYLTKPIDRDRLIQTIEHWLAVGAAGRPRPQPTDPTAQPASASEPQLAASGGDAIVDLEILERLEADTGPVVVKDLVKTFILETVTRVERVAEAAHAGDLTLLEHEAHALKGSSSTFGAPALRERAAAIERACKAGDGAAALKLIDNLREMAVAAAEAMVRHFEAPRPAADNEESGRRAVAGG